LGRRKFYIAAGAATVLALTAGFMVVEVAGGLWTGSLALLADAGHMLGDAGSLPIGLCLAFMLIYVAEANIAAAMLLPLYMIVDTSITLVRRIINKEPFLSAHRSHYYQRAVTGGRSVPEVTTRIFLLGFTLALLAVGATLAQSIALDLVALALGVLATAATLHWLARGRA